MRRLHPTRPTNRRPAASLARFALICSPVVLVVASAACAGDDPDDDAIEPAAESSPASEPTDPPAAESSPASEPTDPPADGSPTAQRRAVALDPDMTWHWQLDGDLETGYDVDVYDVDLFDTPVETVARLHADGRVVVCYFSAGSWEDWRDDAGEFPASAVGQPLDGWEGERWVDVRDAGVRSVMAARLDLAATKGCDGVEPDNVAAYDDDTGFDFGFADQLDYNRFLAASAHERGLLVGLKNALEQIPELVDDFDFAVNEQCHQYDECDTTRPFVVAGKPVFNAEYADEFVDDPDRVCRAARDAGIRTLILPLDLDDSFRISCD